MTKDIVEDIIQSLNTKKISKETEKWLIHWISDEEPNSKDFELIRELALSNAFPSKKTNLFRGCKKLIDNKAESYTSSVYQASRFADKDEYIIAISLDDNCFNTFALTEYLNFLLEDILYKGKANTFLEELLDMFETMSGEEEIIVITDLSQSLILKLDAKGENI